MKQPKTNERIEYRLRNRETGELSRTPSGVPLAFALLLLEHLGRKLIFHFLPIVTIGRPPGSIVNLVLLALEIAGLALSLWRRDGPHTAE